MKTNKSLKIYASNTHQSNPIRESYASIHFAGQVFSNMLNFNIINAVIQIKKFDVTSMQTYLNISTNIIKRHWTIHEPTLLWKYRDSIQSIPYYWHIMSTVTRPILKKKKKNTSSLQLDSCHTILNIYFFIHNLFKC
jgi:hypothetical protein